MDRRLKNILESFLSTLVGLNEEVLRLSITGAINDGEDCLQLVERIRDCCMDSLQNIRTVEHRIHARGLLPPREE